MYVFIRIDSEEVCLKKRNVITIVSCLIIVIVVPILYFLCSFLIAILFPSKFEQISHFFDIVLYCVIGVSVVVCFLIFALSVLKEFNFIKLYQNELKYNGLSDELYEAALVRKKRYSKDKSSVGYVGSCSIISNYFAYHNREKEALMQIEEFDLEVLEKEMGISKGISSKDKLSTYFALIDQFMCLYTYTNDTENVDKLNDFFEPLYNAYIQKYDYLTDILYETRINYLLYKERYAEADSILDILKNSSPGVYYYLKLESMRVKREFDEDIINQIRDEAYEHCEKLAFRKYYRDTYDYKINQINDLKNKLQEV